LTEVRNKARPIVRQSELIHELIEQRLRRRIPLSEYQKKGAEAVLVDVLERYEEDKIGGGVRNGN
jgi:hypothetical protein